MVSHLFPVVLLLALAIAAHAFGNNQATRFEASTANQTPISQVKPQDLGFVPLDRSTSGIQDGSPKSALWSPNFSGKPLPTNTWWGPMALNEGIKDENNVQSLPYVIKCREQDLLLSYPWVLSTNNGKEIIQAFDFLGSAFLSLGSRDALPRHFVSNFDALSATKRWEQSDTIYMQSPLVQGSPYVTMEYAGVLPRLWTNQHPSRMVADGNLLDCSARRSVTFRRLEFDTIETDSTYVLYASEPVTMACIGGQTSSLDLVAESPFTGVLRIAVANNCTTGMNPLGWCRQSMDDGEFPGGKRTPRDQSEFLQLLDAHASAYPVAGAVKFSVVDDEAVISFEWQKREFPGSSSTPLLMLAMPHHVDTIHPEDRSRVSVSGHHVLRGFMHAVSGDVLRTVEPLAGLGFLPAPGSVPKDLEDHIVHALRDYDANHTVPGANLIADAYYAGKHLTRMARDALIANQLGLHDETQRLLVSLKAGLNAWLSRTSPTGPLVYDASWGGIVECGCMYQCECSNGAGSCDRCDAQHQLHKCSNAGPDAGALGCPALLTDGRNGMSFGNGFYNDHHYHYGYMVYAAAAVVALDPAWAELDSNHERVLMLIRDWANPSDMDSHFPQLRMKNLYEGSSVAGGLVLFNNGKNQESTSEAVHAYYGMALYGQAVGDVALREWGRVMLALEIRSAKRYWQDMSAFPSSSRQYGCVGILWTHSALLAQTWFGTALYYVHGIQMIPFSPISELLLTEEWLSSELPIYAKSCDGTCASQGWDIALYMAKAVLDPHAAWAEALADTRREYNQPGDNGFSRTSNLYWIATRPGMHLAQLDLN